MNSVKLQEGLNGTANIPRPTGDSATPVRHGKRRKPGSRPEAPCDGQVIPRVRERHGGGRLDQAALRLVARLFRISSLSDPRPFE